MHETVTKQQLRKMSKIFRKTNTTFQKAAEEAGLSRIPDHANELSKEEARKFLKYFSAFLIEPKQKL
jgi:hypothetical protein